jgi:hypothetical protein
MNEGVTLIQHPLSVLLAAIDRGGDDQVCICHKTDDGPMGFEWTTADEAYLVADRYAGREHVWFGVQPMTPPVSGRGRGTQRDVRCLRTLYADLDFLVEGKPGGMDPVVALEIVEALSEVLGQDATAIVRSGYGLQPYWALAEDVEVIEGALLLARWRQVVIVVAAAHGVKVDTGVYDLARILRVPGPPNLKYGASAATGLTMRDGERLTLREVQDALDSYAPVTADLRRAHGENIARRAGEVPQVHGGDRVFTDVEAMEFIEEFALRRARETPWGGGADFWKVIWEAAMTASNFSEMFSEDDLRDMLRAAVADGHDGVGTDAADEYQIAMGFMKGREWLARRPTAGEEADPFSSHCTLPGQLAEEYAGATDYDVMDVHGVVLASSDQGQPRSEGGRRLVAICAAEIAPVRSRWLWKHEREHWIPLGALVLLGGREGVGKSTWCARLIAQVTNGKMEGEILGRPADVAICATEDAWAETIIPRLMAAGADLKRIWRIDVRDADVETGLSLPADVPALRQFIALHGVAMVILDPLLGAISGKLDTHKDQHVRIGLEPISRLAADTGVTVIGLIHQNKSQSGDLLTRLMGSRAFSAVARAVLVCAEVESDAEMGEDTPKPPRQFKLGQLKSNLAARVETSIKYEIQNALCMDTEEIWSSRIHIIDYLDRESIEDASLAREAAVAGKKKRSAAATGDDVSDESDHTKVEQCMERIAQIMSAHPDGVEAAGAKKSLESEFSVGTVQSARGRLGVGSMRVDGRWIWKFRAMNGQRPESSNGHTE